MKDRKLWPKLRNGTQWALIVAFITGACSPTVSQPKETEPVPATPVVQITDFVPSPPPEELPTAAEKQETLPPVATQTSSPEPTPIEPIPGGSYTDAQRALIENGAFDELQEQFGAWLKYWNASGLYNFDVNQTEWVFNPTNDLDVFPVIDALDEYGNNHKFTFPVDIDNDAMGHKGTGRLRKDAPAVPTEPFVIAPGDGPLEVSSGRAEVFVLRSADDQPVRYGRKNYEAGEFVVAQKIGDRYGGWENTDPGNILVDVTEEQLQDAANRLGQNGCCTTIDRTGPAKLTKEFNWTMVLEKKKVGGEEKDYAVAEVFYVDNPDGGQLRVTALVGVTTRDGVILPILVPVQAEKVSDQPRSGYDLLSFYITMCAGQEIYEGGSVFLNPQDLVARAAIMAPNTPFMGHFTADINMVNQYGLLDTNIGLVAKAITGAIPDYWGKLDMLVNPTTESNINTIDKNKFTTVDATGIYCWPY